MPIAGVRAPAWGVAISLTVAAFTLPGCTTAQVGIDCVVGAHVPAGRDDVCVPNVVPRTVQSRLLSAARAAARQNGGTARRVVAVESLRSNALRYTGRSLVAGDGFVWFVEVSGHFGGESALTFDVGVTSGAVNDLSLHKAWIDPSHLGIVVPLSGSERTIPATRDEVVSMQ